MKKDEKCSVLDKGGKPTQSGTDSNTSSCKAVVSGGINKIQGGDLNMNNFVTMLLLIDQKLQHLST